MSTYPEKPYVMVSVDNNAINNFDGQVFCTFPYFGKYSDAIAIVIEKMQSNEHIKVSGNIFCNPLFDFYREANLKSEMCLAKLH